jgi:hypothetical protein
MAVSPPLIDETGKFIGNMHGASYFAANFEPGKHGFILWSESNEMLEADLAADRVYVIEVFGFPGVMAPRFTLSANYKGGEKWPYPRAELKELTATEVKRQAEGDAWFKQSDRTAGIISDGKSNFAGYQGQDKRTHTLNAEDGFEKL